MFKFWKKREDKPPKSLIRIVNETTSGTGWSGSAYANDIFRAGVDTISRHAAKLRGRCETSKRVEYLLSVRANPYMSTFDTLYKLFTHVYTTGNGFLLYDGDNLWPVDYSQCTLLTDASGELFAEFILSDGSRSIFKYKELIHIRRFFNEDKLLGSDNTPLYAALELAEAENSSLTAGIRAGASIRGILEINERMTDTDLKQARENFVNNFLGSENAIVPMDARFKYNPIEQTPTLINAEQSAAIREKIYSFLGISQKIVAGTYGEEDALAFSEGVIEPLAIQLGAEFSYKLGREISFDMSRLSFVAPQTKVELLRWILPAGVLSTNQCLEILNLPTIGVAGDVRMQSLNYAQVEARENAD